MAPIQTYSSSPINAPVKASAITPQTAGTEGSAGSSSAPATTAASTTATTTATTTSAPRPPGYPNAQPGAVATRPTLPVQTGAPQTSGTSLYQPTPTTQHVRDQNPPAPQPGAVPVPPEMRSQIPPPPKAGESMQHRTQPPAAAGVVSTTTTSAPVPLQSGMPPQVSYPAPNLSYSGQVGSSSTISAHAAPAASSGSGALPTASLGELGPDDKFSHPPGYQQNALASAETSSHLQAGGTYQGTYLPRSHDEDQDDESLWGMARQWATAAGNSLAQAENEVWKRINKG